MYLWCVFVAYHTAICNLSIYHVTNVSGAWKFLLDMYRAQALEHYWLCFVGKGWHTMTSSNGNIFCVTGPLCGNSPVTDEFHSQRLVTRSFDVFFDPLLNKWLSKDGGAGDLRRYRSHYDITVMIIVTFAPGIIYRFRHDGIFKCILLQKHVWSKFHRRLFPMVHFATSLHMMTS